MHFAPLRLLRTCFGVRSGATQDTSAPQPVRRVSVADSTVPRMPVTPPRAENRGIFSCFKSWMARTFRRVACCGFSRNPQRDSSSGLASRDTDRSGASGSEGLSPKEAQPDVAPNTSLPKVGCDEGLIGIFGEHLSALPDRPDGEWCVAFQAFVAAIDELTVEKQKLPALLQLIRWLPNVPSSDAPYWFDRLFEMTLTLAPESRADALCQIASEAQLGMMGATDQKDKLFEKLLVASHEIPEQQRGALLEDLARLIGYLSRNLRLQHSLTVLHDIACLKPDDHLKALVELTFKLDYLPANDRPALHRQLTELSSRLSASHKQRLLVRLAATVPAERSIINSFLNEITLLDVQDRAEVLGNLIARIRRLPLEERKPFFQRVLAEVEKIPEQHREFVEAVPDPRPGAVAYVEGTVHLQRILVRELRHLELDDEQEAELDQQVRTLGKRDS